VAVVEAPAKAEELPAVTRLNPIKLRQLEDRLRLAEEEILRLETAIAAAEEKMGVFTSAEESQRTAGELEQLRGERAKALTEWEELALMVEEQSLV
jgi:ATP-binding cassette subfamily F protein 3